MNCESQEIKVVHYWAGCPKSPNSKWQSFLEVVRRCRKQGWKNYLVWSKMPDNNALSEPFEKEDCEIILQPRSRGNFDIASVWRTYKLMRSLKCDVFHCHNDHTSPLIGAALAQVPVRIWSKLAMSPYYENNSKPKGLHRLMPSTRISCLCAHRILAISDAVGREVIETVGFGDRIVTVHVPVDYGRFANAAKGNIRQEIGFDDSNVLITAIGHAVPVKGWDIAIKVFVQVHQQFPKIRLLLVGDKTSSQFYSQLAKLTKEYAIENNICFTGKRDDIPQILKASDIFILPSRSDGLCLALIEAMASGLPCIASDVGGVSEVITHGEDGLLFERENSKQLAQAIIRLIKDKKLQKKLSSQASVRARYFSMDKYVEKVFKSYEFLFGRKTSTINQNEKAIIRT